MNQIRDMKPKPASQKGLFVDIVKKATEAGAKNRAPLWLFTAQLFSEEVLQKEVLSEGLQMFMDEVFEDLQFDVPNLPDIIAKELIPMLDGTGEAAPAALLDETELE